MVDVAQLLSQFTVKTAPVVLNGLTTSTQSEGLFSKPVISTRGNQIVGPFERHGFLVHPELRDTAAHRREHHR